MEGKQSLLLTKRNANVPQGPFNTTPAFIERATGALMIDVDGKEYVDWAGGIGVNNVGHCHPRVVAAIKDQAEKYIHTCFHVAMYNPYVDLAERLNRLAPGDDPKMTYFANSGAEAVENAIKVARYAKGRPAVICFDNAFHGRTFMAMSLTSKIKPYKYGFEPFMPEIHRVPFAYCYRCPLKMAYPKCETACADYLEEYFQSNVSPDSVAAIIAEPIQGEGGFITPPPEYFPKLRKICDKYGISMIIDEIQAGSGRTGTFFAIEHWGVVPDIITLAKSFAGGMPLSAIIGRADLMNRPHMGALGGTYGGNPISCRAALAVLDALFEDGLLNRSVELGALLWPRFQELQKRFEIIGEVRGKGSMIAMELVTDRESKTPATVQAKKLTQLCYEKGLVILSCGNYGNVIRTLMPFVITNEQIDRGFQILEESLETVSKG
jgi:4-aminobutyrate aminotransferase / (S)-3-amino-2-methylpropionate transaminase / 5-aminovalerate transaminase